MRRSRKRWKRRAKSRFRECDDLFSEKGAKTETEKGKRKCDNELRGSNKR